MKTKKRGKGKHKICAWMLTFVTAVSLLAVPAKKVEAQSDSTKDVNTETEYNFAKLLQESLYFYDANMCGEIEDTCALDWRGNCHLADKTATYKGKTVDVSGGYHDAGDHDKFGLPQGYSASILGIGYYEFKEAYEELGQTAHFKKILDHFCDYFVRCTVLDGNGDAEAFCYQVGDGNSHNYWVSAEDEHIDRPAYFADASDPATDQVSEAAAALAIHYVNFGDQNYLNYAKKLFALAKNSSKAAKASNGGNFYASSSWADDYCLAAAWLYKATGDSMYQSEYNSYKGKLNPYCWPSWDGVDAYAAAYGEGNWGAVSQNADCTINGCKTLDNGYRWLAQWGSARYNCNMQLEGLIYDKNKGGDTYSSWATGQMKFLLGNNNNKQCFVVGYNDHSTKYPHHRTSSGYAGFPSDGNATTPQAHVLIGALAGGIGCEQFGMYEYHDRSDDYYCNEVAIDYNAAFTGAAAALYLYNKNNSAFKTELLTESELAKFGVKSSGPVVEADSVSLDKTTLELKEGETCTLNATVKPDNASDKSVTWNCEDATVASVDAKGVVKAVGAGTTTITVKTKNGKKAVCNVTVTAVPTALLEASVSKVELAKQVYGYDKEPEQDIVLKNRGTAKADQMTYSFKNGEKSKFKVISVQDSVEVKQDVTLIIKAQKGLAAGSYTDTLVIGYNNGVSSVSLEIPVSLTVSKKTITLTVEDASKVYGEKNPAFRGTFTDENGETVPLTDLNVTYDTTATETTDAGKYTIHAVVSGNDNYDVKVVKGNLTITKKVVTEIAFPTAEDIMTGDPLSQSELTGGDTKYGEFVWKTPEKIMTSNDEMEEVVLKLNTSAQKNYEFTGIEGYRPEDGTITQNVAVHVMKQGQKTITFPTASAIKVGQKLSESVLTGGSTEYGTFQWQKPDTVMEKAGDLKFNVVFTPNKETEEKYGNEVAIKEVSVTVEEADQPDPEKTVITLNKTSLSLKEGEKFTLKASVTPESAADKELQWSSSDSAVASVDAQGNVSAFKKGTASITVKIPEDNVSAVCKVTVVKLDDAILQPDLEKVTFPEKVYGYDSGADLTKVITITNIGEAQAGQIECSLQSGNTSGFMISGKSADQAASGDKVEITVKARAGLAAGSYEDTLLVNYNTGSTKNSLEIPLSFTVSPKSVTITVANVKKVYGNANPAFTATIKDTDGKVITPSDLRVHYRTDATEESPVGAYPVIASVDENPNYEIQIQNGTLTIQKKVVKGILFPTASDIKAGQTLQESELVNGDTMYGDFAWKSPETIMTADDHMAEVVLTLDASVKKNYDFTNIEGYEETTGTITQQVEIYVAHGEEALVTFPTASAIRVGQTLGESRLTGGSTELGTFEWQEPDLVMDQAGNLKFNVVFTPSKETQEKYGNKVRVSLVPVTVKKEEDTYEAPAAKVVARTASSITVLDLDGMVEYSLDGKTWQTDTTFSNLDAFRKYLVYTRYAETDQKAAGVASSKPTVVYTLVENPYVIDVAKLENADYVDALKTVDNGTQKHATVKYEENILTLLDQVDVQNTGYIIEGTNDQVIIKTSGMDYKITLDGATVSSVDFSSTADAQIEIKKNSTIEKSITSSGTTDITISGSGNLKTESIETKGDMTVTGSNTVVDVSGQSKNGAIHAGGTVYVRNGATLTAQGGSNTAGMKADQIIIASGTVTAAGGSNAAGMDAKQVTINGGMVTVTGGSNADGITAEQVTIAGGNIEATGNGTGAAITGTERVALFGGEVKVAVDKEADAAIVTGNTGTILLDEAEVSGEMDNMYSVEPVNMNGDKKHTYTIRYQTDGAEPDSWTETVEEGGSITLPGMVSKLGYNAYWKGSDGETYPPEKSIDSIQSDMTFQQVYERIPIREIKIAASDVTTKVGAEITFTKTVSPAVVLDDSVMWNSSNPQVASIDENGKLKALSAGVTKITATAKDGFGAVSNVVSITVKNNAAGGDDQKNPDDNPITDQKTTENRNPITEQKVEADSLNVTAKVKNASDVPVKATFKLAPKKNMQLKVTLLPEGAQPQALAYSSSNENIVKVSSTGKITAGKKAGKAVVSITSEKGLKKTITVQVMKKAVTKVTIKGAKDMKKGKTLKLKASVAPGNAGKSVVWKSSNKKIAVVDSNGKVKALKKGKVKITATAIDGSGKKASVTIRVK